MPAATGELGGLLTSAASSANSGIYSTRGCSAATLSWRIGEALIFSRLSKTSFPKCALPFMCLLAFHSQFFWLLAFNPLSVTVASLNVSPFFMIVAGFDCHRHPVLRAEISEQASWLSTLRASWRCLLPPWLFIALHCSVAHQFTRGLQGLLVSHCVDDWHTGWCDPPPPLLLARPYPSQLDALACRARQGSPP